MKCRAGEEGRRQAGSPDVFDRKHVRRGAGRAKGTLGKGRRQCGRAPPRGREEDCGSAKSTAGETAVTERMVVLPHGWWFMCLRYRKELLVEEVYVVL